MNNNFGHRLAVVIACSAMAFAALAATGAANPATKSAITHETLWLMKRVGAPIVSPDGKWVVFSVLEPAYDADQEVSDLWIVAADGTTAPRRLTNTKAAENGVA